jgi:phosphonate transport system substrate-binding protein
MEASMKKHIWNTLIGSMLWLAGTAHAELVLGVHPFKPATILTDAFTPLTRYLSEKLGQPVVLRIAKDYQAHIDAVGKNELDIAYMGPTSYVKLREQYGACPLLARQQIGEKPVFHGKIFVRTDSPVHSLPELAGKRFAFGEEQSTMSHLVPRYMLSQAGITVDKLASYKFVGDHVNVALGVLAGDFDAGAVKEDVYFKYQPRGLREIATSEPYSDHVFVASRKMPVDQVRKLREIMLHMNQDPKGVAALQAMTKGITALVPVQDSDYDSLRVVLKKMRAMGVSY